MLDLVKQMLQYWHILIYCFFGLQLIKVIGNFYLKTVEIKTLNKDKFKVEVSHNSKILHIESNTVKFNDLQNLKESSIIEEEKAS